MIIKVLTIFSRTNKNIKKGDIVLHFVNLCNGVFIQLDSRISIFIHSIFAIHGLTEVNEDNRPQIHYTVGKGSALSTLERLSGSSMGLSDNTENC